MSLKSSSIVCHFFYSGPLAALVERKVCYECPEDNDEITLGKNMINRFFYFDTFLQGLIIEDVLMVSLGIFTLSLFLRLRR